MRPPKGFKAEEYPLRHRLVYSHALSLSGDTQNTSFMPIVRFASGATNAIQVPSTIIVNPHNSEYEKDAGALCAKMSIIDRMTISLTFNATNFWEPTRETAASAFTGDSIQSLTFLWRPIFNVYPEKMDAADDDTTLTVAAILGMTKDATNEDVVAVTTNDLPSAGPSELVHPLSTVNCTEVFGDYNYTTDMKHEDHVFDEDVLQDHLRRGTNKGALRSCLGRTRHVTLTRRKPYANFYIDKFVPRAIRRIQPYALFGIQVHMPKETDIEQHFLGQSTTSAKPHLGIKMIANYHEWNEEYDNSRGTPT